MALELTTHASGESMWHFGTLRAHTCGISCPGGRPEAPLAPCQKQMDGIQ